jgi:pullulanase/glycogen debranching enzyme
MMLKGDKESLLAIFNAAAKAETFTLPEGNWQRVLDTSKPALDQDPSQHSGAYAVPEKSVVVFTSGPGKNF